MTPVIDTPGLRAAAMAATPGEWRLVPAEANWHAGIDADTVGAVVWIAHRRLEPETGIPREEDVAYIVAAQPQTMLALLDRIEALEAALRPFANMLPDSQEPKNALQQKLQEWCRNARTALAQSKETA